MSLLDYFEGGTERGGSNAVPLLIVKLAGDPVGKGRPKARIVRTRGGAEFISVYTPTETRKYEEALRAAALDAMRGRKPFDGELELTIFSYYPIPESWSLKKQQAAFAGLIRPTVKPDWDNVAKITDALSPFRDPKTKIKIPVVWGDDAQVVDAHVHKIYARQRSGLIIEIRRPNPPPAPWHPMPNPAKVD